MATLVFAKEFLDDFVKLEPPVRQKVRELPDKFEQSTHAGVHLEKLTGAKDDRVRTVRVDQYWRGVVVSLGQARFALLRVLGHDEANDWAVRQRLGVNPTTGLVEVLDVPTVEAKVEAVTANAVPEAPRLFDDRRDRDFIAVGIDEELIPLLRRLVDEAELYAIANYLPDAQADAVLLLADGKTTDEVWAELSKEYDLSGDDVDPDDLETALEQPGSKSSFIVTTNDAELVQLLSGDFEAWRTFLHPTQRALAYRPTYNGPAKVTGGAGTGKTVVAIHRARFLAQQMAGAGNTGGSILLATYTTSLAGNLDRTLRSLCTDDEYDRIEVSTVDALARRVLAAGRTSPRPVPAGTLRTMADSAAKAAGLDGHGLDGGFLITEWEQVVLARDLSTLAAYATSPRPGRGAQLNRELRKKVWSGIEHLTQELESRRHATWLQLADQASRWVAGTPTRQFAHVIVDEAQDLHPAQWRLLRAIVEPGPNDLFIAGDAHQRIYDHRVSLASLGIDTRGRSRRLKINYRTSQQILGWTLGILTGQPIDDLDGDLESDVGYRSAFDGPVPTIQSFGSQGEEADFVAAQVREWIDDGVDPRAIGITGRTRGALETVHAALDDAGIEWCEISKDDGNGVRVGTMHSCKGLEFARLAVVAVNEGVVPLPFAVTPAGADTAQRGLDLLRERCLLYVACTRARDELMVTASGTPSPFLPTP